MARSYNWAMVGYPESLQEGWQDLLEQTMVKIAISPLHDKDIDSGGALKKPHYHILFNFDSLKSLKQVTQIAATVGAARPIRIHSLGGYHDYLTHKHNKDKESYSQAEIVYYNGFDATVTNDQKGFIDYYKVILEDNCRSLGSLVECLLRREQLELLEKLPRYTYLLKCVMEERR